MDHRYVWETLGQRAALGLVFFDHPHFEARVGQEADQTDGRLAPAEEHHTGDVDLVRWIEAFAQGEELLRMPEERDNVAFLQQRIRTGHF